MNSVSCPDAYSTLDSLKSETETLNIKYFPDNISYLFLRGLGCHGLNFMEVFIGQPDLLDTDLHWLQDAEIGLPIVVHLFAAHIPLLRTKCLQCF